MSPAAVLAVFHGEEPELLTCLQEHCTGEMLGLIRELMHPEWR